MARSSRPLSRRAGTATEAETIVIVCEGEKTEDMYFNGIRREYRLTTARITFIGLGADPLTVVKRAEQLKPDYDHAWAVFDIESAGPYGKQHAGLDAAVARADRAGIRCAISTVLRAVADPPLSGSMRRTSAMRVHARSPVVSLSTTATRASLSARSGHTAERRSTTPAGSTGGSARTIRTCWTATRGRACRIWCDSCWPSSTLLLPTSRRPGPTAVAVGLDAPATDPAVTPGIGQRMSMKIGWCRARCRSTGRRCRGCDRVVD